MSRVWARFALAVALGYPGDAASLPKLFQERERAPRSRKPLDQFVFSGQWRHSAPLLAPAGNSPVNSPGGPAGVPAGGVLPNAVAYYDPEVNRPHCG